MECEYYEWVDPTAFFQSRLPFLSGEHCCFTGELFATIARLLIRPSSLSVNIRIWILSSLFNQHIYVPHICQGDRKAPWIGFAVFFCAIPLYCGNFWDNLLKQFKTENWIFIFTLNLINLKSITLYLYLCRGSLWPSEASCENRRTEDLYSGLDIDFLILPYLKWPRYYYQLSCLLVIIFYDKSPRHHLIENSD